MMLEMVENLLQYFRILSGDSPTEEDIFKKGQEIKMKIEKR